MLRAILSAFALAMLASHGLAADAKPNILFIYTDDQSHRTVGCYPESYSWVKTPQIDKLAARGVRFANGYSGGAWCMPSRATMLTGHYQHAVESMRMEGTYPGSEYDPAKCPFWPKTFRANGYSTAQVGKWHTGTDTGFGRDWDYQAVWNRPKYPENSTAYYYNYLLSTNGAEAVTVKEYSTDHYTKLAVDYIQGKNRDAAKPWYLWLCYGGVHGPYTPEPRHKNQFVGEKVPVPADIYPSRPGKPDYASKMEKWVPGPNGEPIHAGKEKARKAGKTLHESVVQVQQCVSALDEGIGRVLEALEASGQLKNTLVVYTADQGFAWGQHGFEHKLGPYDACMKAPFIVSMPGTIPEGKVCNTPVGGIDLVPTFFAFAGLKQPWEMHGRDLTPLLKNPEAHWPHPTMMVSTYDHYGSATNTLPPKGEWHNGVPWWVFLRKGDFKYIRTLEEGEIEELYDLKKDPEELNNLALDKAHDATLKEFRAATIAELKRTKAGFADKLPAVR